MKITTDLLRLIHDRVREACIAKHGVDMDYFKIYDDGTVCCKYTPSYSYADEEDYYLNIEDLQSEGLDQLIAERKTKEQERAEKLKEEQRLANERRIIREKEERKQQYLKLKKEFGS